MFADPFTRARDAGLHITVHAGEAAGPESVWDAVNHLGAERIGHGVRSAEDLKTDNPRVSNVRLSQEHRTAMTEVGLSTDQLALVAQQAATAAFKRN